ncbi:MAG: hypothetical protein HOC23_17405 [Halieaceae bacterium]|jgi:hypothetical protein|nr:hypothetical protein [Halieaceae bacterium]
MQWLDTLRDNLKLRPWWMNLLMAFCAYMAIFYVPWDFLFKPVAQDQEVWFGILLTGWAAKATEPLHWLIYAAGSLGFWKMKAWMFPWASLYTVQVAISMFMWQFLDERGQGIVGTISALPFIILAIALWRSKPRFQGTDIGD